MRTAFFSATFLASSLAVAATPIDGLYLSFFGGYSYLPDNISKVKHDLKFDRAEFVGGYNAGARGGYQWNHTRLELEYTYITANAKAYRAARFPRLNEELEFHRVQAVGQTIANLGMGNIYYDFPQIVPCISPYLGAGLGYAFVLDSFSHPPLYRHSHFKASEGSFAFQGTAGFTFNFYEDWALNIAYRYIGTTRLDNFGKDYKAHVASAGIIYRYNGYIYK